MAGDASEAAVASDGEPTRALSAVTYLLRNPRRVVPVALILALVTALLVAVIAPTNVFDTTAEEYIRPLQAFTIVTPQLRHDFDEALVEHLDANPHEEGRISAKMLWIDTPAIIGEMSSPLLALRPEDRPELLRRLGLRLVEGRLPEPVGSGAALHESVLKARGLSIGDEFGRIVDPDDSTPGKFVVVGVLAGPARLGVLDLAYASIPDFVLARQPSFQVVYARPGQKAASDAYLRGVEDRNERAVFRVLDERWARQLVHRNLKNLPIVLGFITGAVAVIVALVSALLNVITFQGRVDEFALLLALGHRRRRLVRKLSVETSLTALVGWALGLGLGVFVVWAYDRLLLAPRAIAIEILDPRPFLFSLAVPVLAAVVSAFALAVRLKRMDPVSVLQRRGG